MRRSPVNKGAVPSPNPSFILICTPTVIVRRPDRGVVRLTLGEFMQERRLAAQSLRQAELDRCVDACMRRLRTLRSTAKWRVRQAVRRMATLRGPASPQPR